MLKKPFSVLVVIQNTRNEFLLIQRADDAAFWQSVTGCIEDNETPLQCAYREVFEETGINCEELGYTIADLDITNYYDIRKDWRHRYESGSITNTEYVFYLKVETDTAIILDPNEHTDFVWLDFKTAYTRFYSKTNKEAAELIFKNQNCKL